TITYQWFTNGVAITNDIRFSGATSSTLSISGASAADTNWSYSVVVSGAGSSVTSSSVTLSVIDPPAIAVQPLSRTIAVGDKIVFAVTATGVGPLTYQWMSNSVAIPGAISTNYYSKANAQVSDQAT